MEKLIMLGTGNALVTRCYNTCFAIQDDDEYFLVDAGGGNGILRQLDEAGISLDRIHHIFLTHEHTDHLLGMIWMIRMIATRMRKEEYEGDLYIYCHSDLVDTVRTIANLTLPKKFTWLFDHRILFVPLYNGDTRHILDYDVTFFDIFSTKAKQYGFTMVLKNGERLTCAGDEPLNEKCFGYAQGSSWLLHEAFCLYSQQEQYKPYEKHHSTVREACELAEYLEIPNLVLYHTEDDNISRRKALYMAEGRLYYHGNLFVPDDLECIGFRNGEE
ncbi:MAG: MBL fold metallo-hydrolase [Coprococcus sp.]